MNSYPWKANNWKTRDDVDCALNLVVGGFGPGPAGAEPWRPLEYHNLHDAVYTSLVIEKDLPTHGLDKFLRSVARA